MPKEYRNELKILLDAVPGVEGQAARNLVEKAMQRPISEVFSVRIVVIRWFVNISININVMHPTKRSLMMCRWELHPSDKCTRPD